MTCITFSSSWRSSNWCVSVSSFFMNRSVIVRFLDRLRRVISVLNEEMWLPAIRPARLQRGGHRFSRCLAVHHHASLEPVARCLPHRQHLDPPPPDVHLT